MNHQQKHNDAGFTLVEVMIALLVFTVGVLALAKLQVSAVNNNTRAWDITEASAFGSDQIEQMAYWDYNNSSLDSSNDSFTYTLSDGETYTADGYQADPSGVFEAYWDVTTDYPVPGSKTIDMTVIWELKGVQKTLSLSKVKAT